MKPGEIDNIIAQVSSKLRGVPKRVAEIVLERVVQRTPVRSGLLQASWHIKNVGSEILVSNNAPYAWHVEFGTMRMAPRAMLRTTLLELPEITVQAVKEVVQ